MSRATRKEDHLPNIPSAVPDFANYTGQSCFTYRNELYADPEVIGSGRFGTVAVFHAKSVKPEGTPPTVVIKTEKQSPLLARSVNPITGRPELINPYSEGQNFKIEARWNKHVYGFGEFSGDPNSNRNPHFLMLLFIQGVQINKLNPNNLLHLVKIFIVVLTAFQRLHEEKHVVHGDIKGPNILYTETDDCYPIDFGLMEEINKKVGAYSPATSFDKKLQRYLTTAETYPQIAPELFGKEEIPASPAQDAYGLGDLLFNMSKAFSKQNPMTPEQKLKIALVIQSLRQQNPRERISLANAKYELHCGFFSRIILSPAPPNPRVSKRRNSTGEVNEHPKPTIDQGRRSCTPVAFLPALAQRALPKNNIACAQKGSLQQPAWRH